MDKVGIKSLLKHIEMIGFDFRQIFTFLLILVGMRLAAQTNARGYVFNNKAEPIGYATLSLLNPADSTLAFFGISSSDGHFEIRNISSGTYIFQCAYLGYQTVWKKVQMPVDIDLGNLILMPSSLLLNAVEISADRVPIRLKKDTLEYDAAAFKTKPDALVEDLLKKLPGLEVDKAGNIKAQGEDVKNVLVDGKVFFGNDLKIATRNLPADAIKKVQVLDKKSEESEFSGIQDGQHEKTINLVLKDDKKKAVFGDVMAGAGTDGHYQGSEKVFRFSGQSQFAALGMLNNINQFGFSFQDYLKFNGGLHNLVDGSGELRIGDNNNLPVNFGQPVTGLITSGAAGLNYTFERKKGNRFNISYIGDGLNKDFREYGFSRNFLNGSSFINNDTLFERTINRANRLNLDLRFQPDSSQHVFLNAGAELSNNHTSSTEGSASRDDFKLLNRLSSQATDHSNGVNGNVSAYYLKRTLGKWKLFKLLAGFNGSQSLTKMQWSNLAQYPDNGLTSSTQEYQNNLNSLVQPSLGIVATRSLKYGFYLEPQLNAGLTREAITRRQGYPPEESNRIDSLSPHFTREYLWLKPAAMLKYNTETIRFGFLTRLEYGRMYAFRDGFPSSNRDILFFTPLVSFENDYKTGCRYNIRYQAAVNTPNANQLLPVQNNFNPLQLYIGNENLKPEYQHQLLLSWMVFDEFSFTSFFANLESTYTHDKINWSRSVDPNLVQTLSLINVSDDYRVSGNMEFSKPLRSLGIKLHLNIKETWNQGINIVNQLQNTNTNLGHEFTLSLDNLKKKKWDANMGAGLQLSDARYSIARELNNRYFNVNGFAEIRFLPNERWHFMVAADVTQYNASSFNQSVTIPLLKFGMSRYFLKGNRGVISLDVFDLLNKNTGLQRISELNYLQEKQSNIIGRYLMLTLKYRLSRFEESKGTSIELNGRKE
jgi:hypothetical protein